MTVSGIVRTFAIPENTVCMEYDIFISYSRKDTQIVDQFVRSLTDAGYRVWIDREGIYSGDEFSGKLAEAIDSSAIVLFFSSANSKVSEWSANEISYAMKYNKTIIPIKLDDTEFEKSLEIRLINIDFIQYRPNQLSSTIDRLIASIAKHLGKNKSGSNQKVISGSLSEKQSKHNSQPATPSSSPAQPKMPPEELFSLGKRHYNHNRYREAAKCFRIVAEQGNAAAQFYLGHCYYNGQQDYQKAVEWYRKAAEQGYAEAQFMLGICFEGVAGVQQDIKQAIKWYRKAAKQGHEKAIGALDRLRFEGKLRRWPWS